MKKTIRDVNLNNKTVLIRVDFNVPMKNGVITNDNRIVQAIPTIQYALDQNAKVVLFSHLGRVKTEEDKAKNSLAPVAAKLAELLGAETLIHVTMNQQPLTAKVNARVDIHPRDEIELAFDMNKCHFFDPETELRIVR